MWYEDPFEGRANVTLLDCIRNNNMRIQKENKKVEEKIEELKG